MRTWAIFNLHRTSRWPSIQMWHMKSYFDGGLHTPSNARFWANFWRFTWNISNLYNPISIVVFNAIRLYMANKREVDVVWDYSRQPSSEYIALSAPCPHLVHDTRLTFPQMSASDGVDQWRFTHVRYSNHKHIVVIRLSNWKSKNSWLLTTRSIILFTTNLHIRTLK